MRFAQVEVVAGLLLLVASYIFGVATRLFVFHVTFPLGFWLLFDGVDYLFFGNSLLRRWREASNLIVVASLAGVFLDFEMVVVTGILAFLVVNDAFTAFQMYVGWGFTMPAIIESYRVILMATRRWRILERPFLQPAVRGKVLQASGGLGLFLAAMPLFFYMYTALFSGWLIIPGLVGTWLLLQYQSYRRDKANLLSSILSGYWNPLLALSVGAILLVLSWEGLNALMQSWFYQNLFLLEPKVLGVPPVAFFGYGTWYALFLALYGAVFKGSELEATNRIEEVQRMGETRVTR